ncbi:hypothetical protein [Nocardiopsis protaetiae]|uniref:hypothetical protein n=1 Tax=Nocardiopsis protaetiae TaxID=3382270 RepID=UPI00387B2380
MTTTIEDRYYMDDPMAGEPVTDTCVYEVTRLGTAQECGERLPDDAPWDELFCRWHQLAVDRGEITYADLCGYRAHYGV